LPAPAWVKAERQSDGKLKVTWATVTGAVTYSVERFRLVASSAEWNTTTLTQPLIQGSPDITLTATPVTYIYSVRAKASDGLYSARTSDYSTTATNLWSQTVASGQPITGAPIQELRLAVDAFRYAYRQSAAYVGSSTPTGLITAANISDLVVKLNQARTTTIGAFVYVTVPSPSPGGPILAQHILQLRSALD
ncbi:MAG: hypothetical protein ACTHQM_25340, partial [Thermoanaerobaculia bacterium]